MIRTIILYADGTTSVRDTPACTAILEEIAREAGHDYNDRADTIHVRTFDPEALKIQEARLAPIREQSRAEEILEARKRKAKHDRKTTRALNKHIDSKLTSEALKL